MNFNITDLHLYPTKSGVYLMKDASGSMLYIGKAKNLRKRIQQYFTPARENRIMIPYLVKKISSIDFIVTLSEKEAFILENSLIKKYQPKYNILLKDDKTFLSITINVNHTWPYPRLLRYKGTPPRDVLSFGPYISAARARRTLEFIQTLFPLRQCSDSELARRKRPCILYGMNRCIAPCVGKCTAQEYKLLVNEVIQLLQGKNKKIITALYAEMKKESDALRFEKAKSILEKIQDLEYLAQNQSSIIYPSISNSDVIGLSREGSQALITQFSVRNESLIHFQYYKFPDVITSNSELLKNFILQHYESHSDPPKEILLPEKVSDDRILQEVLKERQRRTITLTYPKQGVKYNLITMAKQNARAMHEQVHERMQRLESILLDLEEKLFLNQCPLHIECFDTSHTQGSFIVAARVTYIDGKYDKKRTRLYQIKAAQKGDDYSALREVLTRRLIRAEETGDFPDLILIDGGKGHLNIGLQVLQDLNIAAVDMISMAKDLSKHTKGLTQEKIFLRKQKDPLILPLHSPSLFLLQSIRDTAHRVAIQYHRKKRIADMKQTVLSTIPGIGRKKIQQILSYFGSIQKLQEASQEELEKVPKLNKRDRQILWEFILSSREEK